MGSDIGVICGNKRWSLPNIRLLNGFDFGHFGLDSVNKWTHFYDDFPVCLRLPFSIRFCSSSASSAVKSPLFRTTTCGASSSRSEPLSLSLSNFWRYHFQWKEWKNRLAVLCGEKLMNVLSITFVSIVGPVWYPIWAFNCCKNFGSAGLI